MSSTFAWLDHSEEQRHKVLDVLDLFKEGSTVDELGLATIRNAADMLFPGTSAPQTRARYFLFVPWTYLELEAARVARAEVARKARRDAVVGQLSGAQSPPFQRDSRTLVIRKSAGSGHVTMLQSIISSSFAT